jgi:hypothetical protein
MGDATIVTDAERGDVLSLDGDGDYVNCGNPAALNFGTNDWSLSAWVKTAMTGTGDENKGTLIGNGGDGGGGHRYCMIVSEQQEGEVTLVIDDNGTGDTIGSQYNKKQARGDITKVNDDVWHHVLGVREGDRIRIYIDGVEEGSTGIGGADYDLQGTVQANVLLGAITKFSDSSIYKTLDGMIDDARIYNCALTEGNARFLAGVGDLVVPPVVVPPTYGPMIAHYELDGDATDSANNNDGTEQGGPSYVAGHIGDAISLDGGQDVKISNFNLIRDNDELSICMWLKPNDIGRRQFMWFTDESSGYSKVRCYMRNGEWRFRHGDGSSNREVRTSAAAEAGEWTHYAAVRRNGDKIYLYINGELRVSTSFGGPAGLQPNSWIGSEKGSRKFIGLIDDVRIYNIALSEENARHLAEVGDLIKPGYYGPLIAHYNFDEGSGDTAVDSSGNGLDGAINGAVYTTDTADGSASSLDFGGDGDHVVTLDAGPYLNYLDELSISLWIQSDLIDTDKGFFMGADSTSDRYGMRYDTTGGDGGGDDVAKYGVMTTGGNEEDESSQYLQTTQWQHLVLSWKSGDGITLYVNGVPDVPTSDKGPVTGVLTGYTRILVGKGGKDSAADAGWDGRVDDVRVYARALSEGEARYLAGVGDLVMPDLYLPMLGHWDAEGDADDKSGNENHGTPLGDATIVMDPEMGLVATFDGDGDAVDVGTGGTYDLFNFPGNFSIAAWVNLRSWGGCWGNVIVGKRGEGGVGWQLRRFGCDDRFSFTTRGMGNDDYPRSNLAPAMNQWYHLVAVRDCAEKRLYINGVLDSAAGVNWARVNPCPHNVYIGARANGGNTGPEAFFNGMIDDVRIYDYALDLGQVRNLAGYTPTPDIKDTWSGRAATTPALEWRAQGHDRSSKSMRVDYTGSGAVTRLEPWDDGKHPHGWNGDFSLGQAQTLTMWFKGSPENAPGKMFAQLTTVVPSGHTQRVVYDGDPEDLQDGTWQQWDITLLGLSTGKPFDPPLPGEEGLPITKIKDVGVGIIAAGGGTLYFDDLRLYPTRCVSKYGPAHDLNGDCVVDKGDLLFVAYEWLEEAETPVETEYNRVAYWDSRYRTNWAHEPTSVAMRDTLSAAGYTVVDADELKAWMDARIADGALSVVVLCRDNAPDTVVESYDASCTLRRYLDAGGKVVYYADIPLWDIGHANGSWTNLGGAGQGNILGIPADIRWDSWETSTITPLGAKWGLTQTWQSQRANNPAPAGLAVLATDSWGWATAYVKHYVPGDTYRGFVRIIDRGGPSPNFDDVMRVAEYIPYLTADTYEDDIVNFFDYADIINHFGEEALFPPPGEQL